MDLLWLLVGISIGMIASGACFVSWRYGQASQEGDYGKRSRHMRSGHISRGKLVKHKSVTKIQIWARHLQQRMRKRYQERFELNALGSPLPSTRENLLWDQVLEIAPIGYIQVDQDNRLVICNAKAALMMNIANHHQGVKRRSFLLQMIRSYELDRLVEKTRSHHEGMSVDWVFHPAIPDPVDPVPQLGRPIRASSIYLDGNQVGIFLEDRQEAMTITQQRDRWTSDIAHELKTPLTSIRLVAETIEPRVDPSAKIWVTRLIQEIERITNIVGDLLDLGQMDVGITPNLNISEVNFSGLVNMVWTTLEPLAYRKKISLNFEGDAELSLQGDKSRLYRLLLNLLDNSIKHSPAYGVITVRGQVIGAEVQIETIDQGEGFPEEALEHIFDRFYRIDASRTRSGVERGGSGLGLAIAYQIVQLHQGKITARNHPQTGGAWMTIQLPQVLVSD